MPYTVLLKSFMDIPLAEMNAKLDTCTALRTVKCRCVRRAFFAQAPQFLHSP